MGPCTGVHGPKHRFYAPIALSLPQVEATSLLAENNQARCEENPVARRVGGPSRAAADEPKSSRGVTEFIHFCTLRTRKSPRTALSPHGGRGRGSKESTRLRYLAFRDSYTTRWEIKFF